MRAALLLLLLAPLAARAADAVVVQFPERATARTALVTVGDVATVSGGSPQDRAAVAALDVAELKARETAATLNRRAVEYRLRLAGFAPPAVLVTGAERTDVVLARRTVAADEVAAKVRAELIRVLPWAGDNVAVELAQPIVVQLPEMPAGETLAVAAKPHAPLTKPGRVQMDTTLSAGGVRLLSLAVYFEVRVGVPAAQGIQPVAAWQPAAPMAAATAGGPVVVKANERVRMVARAGALAVTAVGEAQQAGRVGDVVRVLNVDSKKVVSGRVTGPGAVEVEIGGAP